MEKSIIFQKKECFTFVNKGVLFFQVIIGGNLGGNCRLSFFLMWFFLLGGWSVSLKDPVTCDECDPSLTIIQGVNLLTGMYSGVANNEREHSSRVPVTAFMTSWQQPLTMLHLYRAERGHEYMCGMEYISKYSNNNTNIELRFTTRKKDKIWS